MNTTKDEDYDLLIVGGGINGAGIARDAAGRGLRVLLCDRDDLAAHTSSASTKLVHGGLRYLEYYEFNLVRKALMEREVLLRAAPHIIWPLRFVMPHSRGLRPSWLIRLGLFLYDHLGGRKMLPPSRGVNLRVDETGQCLKPELKRGFIYSDCWVQDSRLVILNAMDARERGATVVSHTACVGATRNPDHWRATLRDTRTGEERQVTAKALVNAAGPWVSKLLAAIGEASGTNQVRLIKGSHIVVPKLFDHDHAYIFQNPDKRIVFAIPYEQDFTLIGTTDEPFEGDPSNVVISDHEVDYLCKTVNAYFQQQIAAADVAWTYSGVRPLYDDAAADAAAVTRDYVLDLDSPGDKAPLLSIFGGKITTYRKLAEEALELLRPRLGFPDQRWTAQPALPGGDIPNADFEGWLKAFADRHPFLPRELAWRYARNYGTRAERLIGQAQSLAELGQHLGDDIYAAELNYLIDQEWAEQPDDVLWRRSRLGLHASEQTKQAVIQWFEDRHRETRTETTEPASTAAGGGTRGANPDSDNKRVENDHRAGEHQQGRRRGSSFR